MTSQPHDWQPSASQASRLQRAQLLATIRQFFHDRGVLEVETPLLCQHTVTDPYIHSFAVDCGTLSPTRFLQTSPEYAMKRLLAAGSGPIYQIGKAFRREETSPQHNPEFTMLEWYRPDWSMAQLMNEIADLIQLTHQATLPIFLTYQKAFQQALSIDPLTIDIGTLQTIIINRTGPNELSASWLDAGKDALLSYAFNRWVETSFPEDTPVFITHFPASQAALATINQDDPRVADRFELYYQGMELANGFQELTDPDEQRARFLKDQAQRTANQDFVPAIDEQFLQAVAHLPSCAGVAVGIDRFQLCLEREATELSSVLNFPFTEA